VPRVTLLVVSIALADSLNPTTVGPALYLTTRRHARRRLAEFAFGVFAVNMAGGVLLLLGPGQLLLSLVPDVSGSAKNAIALGVGVVLVVFGAWLLIARPGAGARISPTTSGRRGSRAMAMGAAIAAVEFPTALPYFAAIATIVASDVALPAQIALCALFNLIFVLPVLLMVVALAIAGPRAEARLESLGDALARHWPVIFGSLAVVVGVGLAIAGAIGLSG
jgi:cytochrome c biogenesis protein CcdA